MLIGGKHWEQNEEMVKKIWLLLVVASRLNFFFSGVEYKWIVPILNYGNHTNSSATRGRF